MIDEKIRGELSDVVRRAAACFIGRRLTPRVRRQMTRKVQRAISDWMIENTEVRFSISGVSPIKELP